MLFKSSQFNLALELSKGSPGVASALQHDLKMWTIFDNVDFANICTFGDTFEMVEAHDLPGNMEQVDTLWMILSTCPCVTSHQCLST